MGAIAPSSAAPALCFAQLLEFVETGGALPNVIEDEGGVNIRAAGGQGDEGFMSRASDAIGIRQIPMHDPLKCVDQLFFPIHGWAVPCPWKNPDPLLPSAESHDP